MKPVNSPAFFMLRYPKFLERTTIFTAVLAQTIVFDTNAKPNQQVNRVKITFQSN